MIKARLEMMQKAISKICHKFCFLNKQYNYDHIRSVLINKKGKNVYCFKCEEVAIIVLIENYYVFNINLPICKNHLNAL